MKRSGVACCS